MKESKRWGGEVRITGVAAKRGWGLCFGGGKRWGKEISCMGESGLEKGLPLPRSRWRLRPSTLQVLCN